MSVLIETHDLTKTYRSQQIPALDSLTLSVKAGEVYGFLGANGAGKSTTIRLLLNFIQPTRGRALVRGFDTVTDAVRSRRSVGYLAGDVALYSKPTGRELLDYLSSLQPASEYRQVLEKRFEADIDKPIGSLSKGNRQKIGIIQACMHQPEVLILDEPTSGLDPLMQEAFYETLRELRSRGAAVLMSSHNLTEAARVCDRIGIIKQGRLVREENVNQLNLRPEHHFYVRFTQASALKSLKKNPLITIVSIESPHAGVISSSHDLPAVLKALGTLPIVEMRSVRTDLEDEFMEYYGHTEDTV